MKDLIYTADFNLTKRLERANYPDAIIYTINYLTITNEFNGDIAAENFCRRFGEIINCFRGSNFSEIEIAFIKERHDLFLKMLPKQFDEIFNKLQILFENHFEIKALSTEIR